MLSFGALNGNVVNAVTINGGTFQLFADAVISVGVGATCAARRRLRGAGLSDVSLGTSLTMRRRQFMNGAAAVTMGAAGTARRRLVGDGQTTTDVSASAQVRARLGAYGSASVIAIEASAALSWRFLHRAPRNRTYALPVGERRWGLPPESRLIRVPAPAGDIVVPRDREAS